MPFYPQTLITPDDRITGVAVVGLPGVLTGRNENLAWGFTNNNADQQDLFIETIHPTDPDLYLEGDRWVALTTRTEVIQVWEACGQYRLELLKVRSTPRGPILTQLLPGVTQALTLSWYVEDLLDGELGLDEMIRADTPTEFLTALDKWPGTTQNTHLADRGGWVGWHIMGHVPLRSKHAGLWPIPASLAASVWDRTSIIPFDRMPHKHDPPQGWTASANHWGYPPAPPVIATSNGAPYRVLRIQESLEAQPVWSEADHRSLQLDTLSVAARRILPALLSDLAADPSPSVQQLRTRLVTWDLRVDVDSVGATLWNSLYRHLLLETLTDDLGASLTAAYVGQAYYFQERFEVLLGQPDSAWFDDVATTPVETRLDITRRAARNALAELEPLGSMDTWTWGRIHEIFFENPIATEEPLRSLLGRGPYPFSGDNDTLQRGAYSYTDPWDVTTNAALRMVADLGDDCSVLGSIATGLSARFEEDHYDDQIPAYLSGAGLRWWMCDSEIEAHKAHELQLQPIPQLPRP